jgi:hypothetical protein
MGLILIKLVNSGFKVGFGFWGFMVEKMKILNFKNVSLNVLVWLQNKSPPP